jgi:hypothetical protein
MLSQDLSNLAADLADYRTTGVSWQPQAVMDIVAVLMDCAERAEAMEASMVRAVQAGAADIALRDAMTRAAEAQARRRSFRLVPPASSPSPSPLAGEGRGEGESRSTQP